MGGNETRLRSLLKTLTWRVVFTIIATITGYFLLGTISASFNIAIISNIVGFVLYYIHERIWNMLRWGKD